MGNLHLASQNDEEALGKKLGPGLLDVMFLRWVGPSRPEIGSMQPVRGR